MIVSKKPKVVIIDYNLGNLFSVKQACDVVGINAIISSSKDEIEEAKALILPGVGAFIEAMNNLEKLDLVNSIKAAVKNGVPFFGICLGMQLIFTQSEEFGSGSGLDLIPGTIKRFPSQIQNQSVKVPQISWNNIYCYKKDWLGSPLHSLSNNEFMYFVHSYYVEPAIDDCILAKTNYEGLEYCSAVFDKNIFATQFHPEKSAEKGIHIYRKWAEINSLV